MKEACKAAIYKWASETDQANAALGITDDAQFIKLVIMLHRDYYNHLLSIGATEWTDDPAIDELLTMVKNGEMQNPLG